jgi:hypothetical protein
MAKRAIKIQIMCHRALCQTVTDEICTLITHARTQKEREKNELRVSFAIFMQKLFTRLVYELYSFYGFIIQRGTCVIQAVRYFRMHKRGNN